MDASAPVITLFDYRNAGIADFAALNVYDNRLRAERTTDALLSVEETMRWWQAAPPSLDVTLAVVREVDGAIISHAHLWSPMTTNNRHLLHCILGVLPERRRQGIGRRLLGFAVADARRRRATILLLQTHGNIPAGEAFARRIGAQRAQTNRTNQLVLAHVDRYLLREWQQAVQSDELILGFWDDAFSAADLPAIADLISLLVNDRPRDNLNVNQQQWTAAQVREIEAAYQSAGYRRLSAYLRHKDEGAFVGYTFARWQQSRPHIIYQGRAVVYPQYRQREWERWLQVALLERLLDTQPQAQFVRSIDVDSDVAVNQRHQEMGFRLHSSESLWQATLADVERYLAGAQEAPSFA